MEPGFYDGILNADYHSGPGVSKSNLDLVAQAPATLEWSRNAPTDADAETAVNIGSAFHALLLEPEMFEAQYVADFAPPAGALVTADDIKAALVARGIEFKVSASKGALVATLLEEDPSAPVAEALQREWAAGVAGRTVLTAGEWRKLWLMRESVMAHPVARKLVEAAGAVERSYYWHDGETGELCRSRMDKTLTAAGMILDVKTTADLGNFARSVGDYRYHVQDAFYSDGYEAVTGEQPKGFVFLAVSTSRDRARYPVRLFSLDQESKRLGRDEYRLNLRTYAECRATGNWPGVEGLAVPAWYFAKASENLRITEGR